MKGNLCESNDDIGTRRTSNIILSFIIFIITNIVTLMIIIVIMIQFQAVTVT